MCECVNKEIVSEYRMLNAENRLLRTLTEHKAISQSNSKGPQRYTKHFSVLTKQSTLIRL